MVLDKEEGNYESAPTVRTGAESAPKVRTGAEFRRRREWWGSIANAEFRS